MKESPRLLQENPINPVINPVVSYRKEEESTPIKKPSISGKFPTGKSGKFPTGKSGKFPTGKSGKFPTKPDSKAALIRSWLLENPDKKSLSNRMIADEIGGVSHALVGTIKKEL